MLRLLSSSRFFAFLLFAAFVSVVYGWTAIHNGDVAEYTLTTIAVANHGTPDVRLADLREGQRRLPELAYSYSEIDRDIVHQPGGVHLPFAKGLGDRIYAIHFFAYSALAALPFKLLPLMGLDPFKCYLVVNMGFVALLGLALRRALDDNLKAAFALGLFLTCGVWSYLRWTSPEVMSAAALLSALLFFCTGAPLRAALLTALGALQNPSILLAFGFMPLLRLTLGQQSHPTWRARLNDAVLGWSGGGALALGAALALIAPLWNQMHFGVPSIIAQNFTSPQLFSLERLHSLFFDLSQGMVIGVAAMGALLFAWSLADLKRGGVRLLAACMLVTLALVLPALPVVNWNSGAQGVMRYAVWAAMPLLFALIWQLRWRQNWRWMPPMMLVLGLQIGITGALERFRYVEFSPLAKRVMEHAPDFYNPDPELFAERVKQRDEYFNELEIYTVSYKGLVTKTLYHTGSATVITKLCGSGRTLALVNRVVDATRGWRYINGPVRCEAANPRS
jgi:hypothetical protein